MAIRNAPTDLMKEAGYGEGYRYAHDEEGAVADLECLPDELVGTAAAEELRPRLKIVYSVIDELQEVEP